MKQKRLLAVVLAMLLCLTFALTACTNDETEKLQQQIDAITAQLTEMGVKDTDLSTKVQEYGTTIADLKKQLEDLQTLLNEKTAELQALIVGKYTIEVIDIDGEVLVNDSYYVRDCETIVKTIQDNYEYDGYTGDYGYVFNSIAGSVVDVNYYLASYENGEYAQTGVDGLVVDAGDKFTFKVECWNTVAGGYGTMDDYDILVDSTIYHYLKTTFKTNIGSAKTYTGSIYWDQAAVYTMAQKGYDKCTFEYSSEYLTALDGATVSSLSGNNLMKYYYGALTIGKLSNDLATRVETVLATSCSDWLLPLAKHYNVTTEKVQNAYNSTSYGASFGSFDTAMWGYVLRGLFTDNKQYLANFQTMLDQGNGCSTALVLLCYAKDGVSARSFEIDGKDVIEALFDTYYDSELNLVKWKVTDTKPQMSTNQIYASLMAYKMCRDTNKAVNIFDN